MKRSLLILSVLALSTHASADVITMKNGDVYRADVLKEEFGKYVQILLKDGSEKRLPWKEIESLERSSHEKTRSIAQAVGEIPSKDNAVSSSERDYPSQMLNTEDKFRLELDLIGFAYDSTWQKISLQATGSGTSSDKSVTNHYFRTAPWELTLAIYMNRWHAYFNFLNSSVNSNDVDDSAFSTLAIAYGLSRNFDIGLFFNLDYASSSQNTLSSSSSVKGSSYGFGPQIRVVAPVAENAAVETTLGVGLSFRDLTIGTTSSSLSGSDTAFISMLRVGTSVSLFKHLSYVGWVDGWMMVGSLDGTQVVNGKTTTGSLQDNVYRLRVVPLGLRVKF